MGQLRILVGGATGFIGSALVDRLRALDHHVVRIVRKDPEGEDVLWSDINSGAALEQLEGFDAIVNLTGHNIGDSRWTPRERERIWDSRLDTTEMLAQRLTQLIDRPRVFVCASAVGFYGDGGETELTEQSPKGEGFLAELTFNWEDATQHAARAGIRTVNLRSGVVIGPGGGVLQKQLPLFRLCVGGRLASGQQYMPWISLRDEVEAIVFVITTGRTSGPVNLVGPEPARNIEFTKQLAEQLHRPAFVPVWPWMLHAAFGRQLTDEMLLASQKAVPQALLRNGFTFQDRTIGEAIAWSLQAAADAADAKRHKKSAKHASKTGSDDPVVDLRNESEQQ